MFSDNSSFTFFRNTPLGTWYVVETWVPDNVAFVCKGSDDVAGTTEVRALAAVPVCTSVAVLEGVHTGKELRGAPAENRTTTLLWMLNAIST
jgi:hypothetical protein